MNTVRLNVDATNPGQMFACCGLMEIASRLDTGSRGWFEYNQFVVETKLSLRELLACARDFKFGESQDTEEADDENSEDDEEGALTPIYISSPITICLDWWEQKSLKTWAGSMKEAIIFASMCGAIDPDSPDPFNQAQVVYEQQKPVPPGSRAKKPKKREPFYFDSRRGYNTHSRDVGFSTDAQKMLVLANPVVEALCFVGLQRCRPVPTGEPRIFNYSTWSTPREILLFPAAIAGLLPDSQIETYQFENWFRTSQRKHKAFLSAKLQTTTHIP
jgi:CRISPR-associated protein Csx14